MPNKSCLFSRPLTCVVCRWPTAYDACTSHSHLGFSSLKRKAPLIYFLYLHFNHVLQASIDKVFPDAFGVALHRTYLLFFRDAKRQAEMMLRTGVLFPLQRGSRGAVAAYQNFRPDWIPRKRIAHGTANGRDREAEHTGPVRAELL